MNVELAATYQQEPLAREAEGLLGACIQCGQCTFRCPTFRLLQDEWDGPRGRIFLIKQFLEQQDPDPTKLLPAYTLSTLAGRSLAENLQYHLDRCLTCRSCEAVCPEGVKYGRLLDIGRELVEREVPRPPAQRFKRWVIRSVVPYRKRFSTLLWLGRRLQPLLPDAYRSKIPKLRADQSWPQQSHVRRMLVWQGCVQPELAPEINVATARVLDRLGIELVPVGSACCGAIDFHMAEPAQARQAMRKNIDAIWPLLEGGAEALVLTASGCGTHFRDYGTLLRDDPRYAEKAQKIADSVRDIAEVVDQEWASLEQSAVAQVDAGQQRIAFQSSCSLQHGQGLNAAVERILKRAGFRLMPVQYGFMCCGAAGTYSLLQEELASSLREQKLKTLLAVRPEKIVTANVGCLAHLEGASPVPVEHWINALDALFSTTSVDSSLAA